MSYCGNGHRKGTTSNTGRYYQQWWIIKKGWSFLVVFAAYSFCEGCEGYQHTNRLRFPNNQVELSGMRNKR